MKPAAQIIILLVVSPASAADPTPPALESVQVTERVGQPVPEELSFQDSTGAPIQLKQYLRQGKPVLLSLNYYGCPMLCSLVLSGMVSGLKATGLKLGRDYLVLTVSIDPRETSELAAEKKRGYLQALGERPSDPAWAFTTGEESQIHSLAEAVGFGYAYDESTKQFAHPAVILALTPDGKVSRYLYGIEFPPRDLKLALIEAGDGKVGTSFDRILLSCFRYDPALRRYGIYVAGILKGGALLVFAMLTALLVVLWKRELKRGTV